MDVFLTLFCSKCLIIAIVNVNAFTSKSNIPIYQSAI